MTDLTTTQMAGGLLDEFVRQYLRELEQLPKRTLRQSPRSSRTDRSARRSMRPACRTRSKSISAPPTE